MKFDVCILVLLLSLISPGAPQPETRISVAFVFWYVPDHGDIATIMPYWHDPGFRYVEFSPVRILPRMLWCSLECRYFYRHSLNKAVANSTFVFVQLHLLCDRSAMRLLTSRHNIDVDWYNLAEEGKLDILRKVSSDFNTFWWISG